MSDLCNGFIALFLKGGMKAVIWTDTYQMLVIYGGLLALIIEGTTSAGGLRKVWEAAQNNSRLQFDV